MRAIEICYINEDDRIGHARGSRGKALGTECELDAGILAGYLGWSLFPPLSSFFVSHAFT